MVSNHNKVNDVNGTGTGNSEGASSGRCFVGEQHGPGRQQATARKRWTKEENEQPIVCFLKAQMDGKRGYRRRMHQNWRDLGLFEISEQHLACQVRSLLKAEKFTAIELEELKRRLNNRVQLEGLYDQQMPRESHVEGRNEKEMERIQPDVRNNDIGNGIEFVEIRQEDNELASR